MCLHSLFIGSCLLFSLCRAANNIFLAFHFLLFVFFSLRSVLVYFLNIFFFFFRRDCKCQLANKNDIKSITLKSQIIILVIVMTMMLINVTIMITGIYFMKPLTLIILIIIPIVIVIIMIMIYDDVS